jgi:hypothetical protein
MDPYGKRVLARLKQNGDMLDLAEDSLKKIFEAFCDELIVEVKMNDKAWDDYTAGPIETVKKFGLSFLDKIDGKAG